MWDLIPEQVLLHVQSADVTRAPRPLGVSTHLKDTPRNWDPSVGASRERIYLEHSTEPGNCGQCCLLFKVPSPMAGQAALQATEKPSLHSHLQSTMQERQSQSENITISAGTETQLRAQQSHQPEVFRDGAAGSPIFPATPRQTAPAMSTERRGPDETVIKPGHIVPQSCSSLHSDGDDSSQPRTPPVTADAISSLDMMQSLSRNSMPTSLSTFDEGYEEEGVKVNSAGRGEVPRELGEPAEDGTAGPKAVADADASARKTNECSDLAKAPAAAGRDDAVKPMQVVAA